MAARFRWVKYSNFPRCISPNFQRNCPPFLFGGSLGEAWAILARCQMACYAIFINSIEIWSWWQSCLTQSMKSMGCRGRVLGVWPWFASEECIAFPWMVSQATCQICSIICIVSIIINISISYLLVHNIYIYIHDVHVTYHKPQCCCLQ